MISTSPKTRNSRKKPAPTGTPGKAKGKWEPATRETKEFLCQSYTESTYVFRATNSGYSAEMTTDRARKGRDSYYTARVHGNEGEPTLTMQLHMPLRDAKLTVQERIRELERQKDIEIASGPKRPYKLADFRAEKIQR